MRPYVKDVVVILISHSKWLEFDLFLSNRTYPDIGSIIILILSLDLAQGTKHSMSSKRGLASVRFKIPVQISLRTKHCRPLLVSSVFEKSARLPQFHRSWWCFPCSSRSCVCVCERKAYGECSNSIIFSNYDQLTKTTQLNNTLHNQIWIEFV